MAADYEVFLNGVDIHSDVDVRNEETPGHRFEFCAGPKGNRTRADYLEKFEQLIEQYNNGSRNIEELFSELLTLTRTLDDE